MKRMPVWLFTLIIALSALAFGSISAYAVRVENPHIQVIGNINILQGPTQGASPGIFRDTVNNTPAYCIDFNRSQPDPSSLTAGLDPKAVFDPGTYAGLQSLLLHGYPFERGSGMTDNEAQAATQLAVWCWTYERLGYGLDAGAFSPLPEKENIYEYFLSLMSAARNQAPPNIALIADDVNMAFDGNSLTGQTVVNFHNLEGGYTMDESLLPAGMVVTGYTGQNGDVLTFAVPSTFDTQSLTVDGILTGHDTRSAMNLFWYDNVNPNQQRMAIPIMDSEAVAVNADLTFNFEPLSLFSITKLGENGETLPNVVFDVYGAEAGAYVAEIVTGADGVANVELSAGAYYLIEKSAARGYRLSAEPIAFTIEKGGPTAISVTNERERGRIHIVKTDADSGGLLPDAVFGVYDAATDERLDELVTDQQGEAVSAELPVTEKGYYLLEEKQPDGYFMSDDRIPVILRDNETVTVKAVNKPMPPKKANPGKLVVIKESEGTRARLPGAVFGVYSSTSGAALKIGEIATDWGGTGTMELPEGDYSLIELSAPKGFQLDNTPIPIRIEGGGVTERTVIDKPVLKPSPTSSPTPSASPSPSPEPTLSPTYSPTPEPTASPTASPSLTPSPTVSPSPASTPPPTVSPTPETTPALTPSLSPEPTPTLTPSSTPVPKLTSSATPIMKPSPTSVPAAPASTGNPDITETSPQGTLKLIKKAEKTGKPLNGAGFGVFEKGSDKKVAELTTARDGMATVSLNAGDYYMLEQEAPSGYLVEMSRIPFIINKGEVTLAEVTDERGEKLEINGEDIPFGTIDIAKTGVSYPMLNAILAILCFIVAAVCGVLLIKTGIRNPKHHHNQKRRQHIARTS